MIIRDELYTQGRTPVEIADRMNKELAGRELFSDHPLDNERLWFMIWAASGAPMGMIGDVEGICMVEPTFKMRQVSAQNIIARLAAARCWDNVGFEAAKAEAARVAPKMHRAEADARYLALLWLMIARGPADIVNGCA
jgi:hypothetical protein